MRPHIPYNTELALRKYIESLNPTIYLPKTETDGAVCRNYAPATKGDPNYDGTITDAQIAQAGKVGRAYNFNGSTHKVALTNSASIKNQSLVSFGAIVEIADTAAARSIYYEPKNADSFTRLSLNITASEAVSMGVRAPDTGGAQTITSNDPLSPGFHLLTFTIDVPNKAGVIYADGLPMAVTGNFSGFTGSVFTNSNPSQVPIIGLRYTGLDTFSARMQHWFSILGRLVTPEQHREMADIADFI
jgi:hypothetical protein